jgi:DNA-binding SARP family transcriptional activator
MVVLENTQLGYVLRLTNGSRYDLEEFRSLSRRAESLEKTDPAGAIERYRKAITLYNGHFLPGMSRAPWVLSIRRHSRAVYANVLKRAIELLRRLGRHAEIIDVCEQALRVEPFVDVEELHLGFMEALTNEGRTGDPLNHYAFFVRNLQAEYGLKPSRAIRNLRERIRNGETELQAWSVGPDAASIWQYMVGADEVDGAYLCDNDVFQYLCRVESRRSERAKKKSFFGVFTLTSSTGETPGPGKLSRAMFELGRVLSSHLRQGDAISQWNDAQYLVFLSHCDVNTPRICTERVRTAFTGAFGTGAVDLHCEFQAVQAWDSYQAQLQLSPSTRV